MELEPMKGDRNTYLFTDKIVDGRSMELELMKGDRNPRKNRT